jgi:hypothetical protein
MIIYRRYLILVVICVNRCYRSRPFDFDPVPDIALMPLRSVLMHEVQRLSYILPVHH